MGLLFGSAGAHTYPKSGKLRPPSRNYYRTLFKLREIQCVGRPQLKNGNLWLKAGSCSALSKKELNSLLSILASHDFAMSGKFSPLPAK